MDFDGDFLEKEIAPKMSIKLDLLSYLVIVIDLLSYLFYPCKHKPSS
jgi:hypothetical protein